MFIPHTSLVGPRGLPAPILRHTGRAGQVRLDLRFKLGRVTVDPTADLVLVVDYGAQYAQLIARRVREAQGLLEIVPHDTPVAEILARGPKAVILSGGPSSVYAPGAPQAPTELDHRRGADAGHLLRLPGDGAGARRGGARTGRSEFGRTPLPWSAPAGVLGFAGTRHGLDVARRRGRRGAARVRGHGVHTGQSGRGVRGRRRAGCSACSSTPRCCTPRRAGRCCERFLYDGAGCRPLWTEANIVEEQVAADPRPGRRQAGDLRAVRRGRLRGRRRARAAGGRRPADLRLRRPRAAAGGRGASRSRRTSSPRPGSSCTWSTPPTVPDRAGRGRRPGGEAEDRRPGVHPGLRGGGAVESPRETAVEFLVQGTLYPDVVESGGGSGAATIKSHHNVGGLPDDLQFALVEPLRTLFKDEVRRVGAQLGLPDGDRLAAAVPRAGAGDPDRRRGDRGAAGGAARGRRDRPGRADRGRAGPGHLAVPGGAARRRTLGRRPGRRPHVRPPGRAAPGLVRGRDDRGLDPGAVRGARADLHPDHQRGAARSTGSCST